MILTSPTVSYSPNPNQAYGVALLIGYSDFWSNIALADGQQTRGRLASDKAWGAGVRIGGLWKINKWLDLGTSAATPVFFQVHSKYRDLFPATMEIPATFRLGVAIHLTEASTLLLDYKELFYGASDWLRKGQGWRNQSIYLAGLYHRFTPELSVGIGYNYAAMPISADRVLMNTTSIPIDEHHISAGFTYKFTPSAEFIFMAYYIPKTSITDNGNGIAGGATKGLKLESRSYGGEIGIKYTF